jgi:hypothetical protein
MKIVKYGFKIAGIISLLLSVITIVVNTEMEYDNAALCFYIDNAIRVLSISIGTTILSVVFFFISKNIRYGDFDHIIKKY